MPEHEIQQGKQNETEQGRKPRRRLGLWAVGLVIFIAITMFLWTGFGRGAEVSNSGRDPVKAYMKVLTQLENPGNYKGTGKLKYVAVDTRGMKGSSDEDQERLLTEIAETYEVEVLTYNAVQLLRKGYLKDNCFENGILFKITDTQFEENPVKMKVLEWKIDSSGSSNDEFVLEFEKGDWNIVEVRKLEKKELS